MKKAYNLLLVVTLAIVSLSFASCSRNDDADLGNPSKLEGTWITSKANGW